MKYAITIMLGAWTSIAYAEGLLPCQLQSDKWLIYNPYTACVSGYLEVSARALGDTKETRDDIAALGQLYGSVALGHWISMHAKGAYTRQAGINDPEVKEYKRTEHAFLQLGHPVADPFYASAGRLDAPFGLNHDVFRLSLPSRGRRLWLTSVNGGRIGVGSREGYRLEVGTSNLVEPNPLTGEERNVISGRIIRTIDLLEGARLMASYATSADYGQRRMGLATLVHHEENRTSFEWIRVTEAALPDYFAQVFRFVHEQQLKKWSWVLGIEDLRKDSYRISWGAKKPWVYDLVASTSLHYQKEREEPRHHWVLIVGLGFGRAWTWEEQDP